MKLTKRKGFNFFRSYYDVYNELNDTDKVAFMDALLDRQFLGIKPDKLKGMANFAYISQTNSIDSQVKGYEDKTKTKLNPSTPPNAPPNVPPSYGVDQPPAEQVEEEVQVQVEEKVEVEVKKEGFHNIDKLIKVYLNDEMLCNAVLSNNDFNLRDKEHLEKRINDFKNNLLESGRNAETWKEFTSYFKNWLRTVKEKPKQPKKIDLNNPDEDTIVYYWKHEGSGLKRTIHKDKAKKFFDNEKIGGYIPVILKGIYE